MKQPGDEAQVPPSEPAVGRVAGRPGRWRSLLPVAAVLGVCAVTLLTHWPVLRAKALTFDDSPYLLDNPLVQNPSWESVRRFMTEVLKPSTVSGYYQPLTMISLMLDWAAGARVGHLEPVRRASLALHVLNTGLVVLFFYLLFDCGARRAGYPFRSVDSGRRAATSRQPDRDPPGSPRGKRVWVAALVGLLFGVHPLAAEPVAWLSERKTLLATFFFLWALIFYLLYVRRLATALPAGTPPRGRSHVVLQSAPPGGFLPSRLVEFCLSLLAFLLAVLSKPTSTPLPVLLILLDWYPLRRLSRRAILEKIPYFVLGCASAIVTYVSQSRAAFIEPAGEKGLGRIVLTICHNIVFYLEHFVWPVDLTSFYPFPKPLALSHPAVLIGVIGTIVLFALLAVSLRWTRAPLTGWLFFFLAIFPTLGIIGFTNVVASMRYLYLPSLGFLLVVAAALMRCDRRWRYATVSTVSLLLVGLLTWGTRQQLSHWRDTETLYRHMLRHAPDAAPLHNDLGSELARQNRLDEAIAHFHRALSLGGPTIAMTHCNLGLALEAKGDSVAALDHFRVAVQMDPAFAPARLALGRALLHAGALEPAAVHLREGLRLKPHYPDLNHPLGQLLARQGKFDEALPYLERALSYNPTSAEIRSDLGNVQGMRGDWHAAIDHYQASLRLKPGQPDVLCNLGTAWLQLQDPTAAAAAFREAIQQAPKEPYAYAQLGQILLGQGKPDEALDVFERGLQVAPADAELLAGVEQARGATRD